MPAQIAESWQSLFSDADQGSGNTRVGMRVIRRRGEPFLIIPLEPRLAAQALSLYPAQSRAARLAKSLMEVSFKFGLSIVGEKVFVPYSNNHAFVQFLMRIADGGEIPPFALLAGNPRAPGRRFVLMLFNKAKRPSLIVKAGKGSAAVRLIEQEDLFLRSVPQGVKGIPQVHSAFGDENIRAIALPYLSGKSPSMEDVAGMEPLLISWIDENRMVRLGELHTWRTLELQPKFAGVNYDRLRSACVHPVIFHGDFAPWNIRVDNDVWQVLDWERGEVAGIPAWDWFHFLIQTEVLVKKQPVPNLVVNVEQMLASPDFQRYAARASIIGLERDLVMAYLHYSITVLQQTEELPRVEGLRDALMTRWASAR